jgi:hypothetical protein
VSLSETCDLISDNRVLPALLVLAVVLSSVLYALLKIVPLSLLRQGTLWTLVDSRAAYHAEAGSSLFMLGGCAMMLLERFEGSL